MGTLRYDWQWIHENWGREFGEEAEQHTVDSGHNDHFILTGNSTITCAHGDCRPPWSNRGKK
jgi:hypothetical protein